LSSASIIGLENFRIRTSIQTSSQSPKYTINRNHVNVRTWKAAGDVGAEDSGCRTRDGYGDRHVQQVSTLQYTGIGLQDIALGGMDIGIGLRAGFLGFLKPRANLELSSNILSSSMPQQLCDPHRTFFGIRENRKSTS